MARTLAHLSDLHLGRAGAESVLATLVERLGSMRVDHVVVTGDIAHDGTHAQLDRFWELMAPLADRVSVIPGNHDRMGDDLVTRLAPARVWRERAPGLYLVGLDTTGPHNRSPLRSQGELHARQLDEAEAALAAAPRGALRVVLMHHQPLALPGDTVPETLIDALGLSFDNGLRRGPELIRRIARSCDLVLHGHKHVPRELVYTAGDARLRIVNGGSSSELGGLRLWVHEEGRLLGTSFVRVVSREARRKPVWRAMLGLGATTASLL